MDENETEWVELTEEEREDAAEQRRRRYEQMVERLVTPRPRDLRPLTYLLTTLVALAFVIGVVVVSFHSVDAQTATDKQKQISAQKNAEEWTEAYKACQKDYVPRFCIEKAHGEQLDNSGSGGGYNDGQ
jgi:hypothetical protein